MLFFIFIMLVSLAFVQASIDTKNSKGLTTTSFFTSDEVFLKSSTGLCNSLYQTVDIYIIESGDTILVDVREQPQEVNLTASYQIPTNTKIWADPEGGNYDVIVDCDKSGAYHPLEPKTSFSVIFKKGAGKATPGKEILEHSWSYDSEQPNLINEMLQLSLVAEGEDIDLTNITIKPAGTGNDTQIASLMVYIDGNNNGKSDEEEVVIGDSQPAYSQDNGETVINLDYTLVAGIADNILIVYSMKEDVNEGNFSLTVKSINGIGKQSGEAIIFSGLPIDSKLLKVLAKKTCLGSMVLDFEPDSVNKGENVIAKISNLTGCDNKTASLRINPCTYLAGDIKSCILKDGTCEMNLTSTENKKYYSCIDKNGDNDKTDFGEAADKDLIVIAKEVEAETEENVSEEFEEFVNFTTNKTEEEKNASITGGVISELLSGSLKGIFVLLEITLLLILIILIIISVRLKGNRQETTKPEKKKPEKSEEKEE